MAPITVVDGFRLRSGTAANTRQTGHRLGEARTLLAWATRALVEDVVAQKPDDSSMARLRSQTLRRCSVGILVAMILA